MLDALRRSIAGERPGVVRRIGSTDIAAIAALYRPELADELPKNKTAGDVWLRLVHGVDLPKSARMRRGNDVEPALLQTYRDSVGPAWRPELAPGRWWTVRHPRHEFATASPDALDAAPPHARTVVELKSQSVWARKQWGEPGTDRLATRYLFQLAWLMACCDVDEAHVLVGFGTDDVATGEFFFTDSAVYRAERDLGLEAQLLEYGQRFFEDFVRTGRPPPVASAQNRRQWKQLTKGWFGK